MIKIFIGYDSKEIIAYHVCTNSIIRHSKTPLSITPLALCNLPYIEKHTDGSNDFVYTRFLVPLLQQYNGWALFIDGDMIVKEDITELWNLRDDSKAVMVVKHDYKTKHPSKYIGAKNADYPRKNWSGVILWNCSHDSNKTLTSEYVSNAPGSILHRFSWLNDDEIGALPIEWNWLSDEFGENENAKLIHYTIGTPCFKQYKNSPMSNDWHNEKHITEYYLNNDTT